MENLKYFKWSFLFTALGLICGFLVGGFSDALIVGILAVLEVSLSFDNAVINAKKLTTMNSLWRQRYLVWGMLISVGFMRLLLPLIIVAVIAHMAPWTAAKLAFANPLEYAKILTSAHHQVSAFGGAFLLMVFLKFFLDSQKEHHWLHVIEAPLNKLGKVESMQILISLVAITVSAVFMEEVTPKFEFLIAGVVGVVMYLLISGLSAFFGDDDSATVSVAKSGFASFIYLEVQDASFSFDGVIGAFALSTNIVIITIGLAIGALFVRSFTLMLVEKNTLSAFRYLEHGAFWAVGALASMMLVSVHIHIPEAVTGLIGAAFIGLALYSSIRANQRETTMVPA